MGGLVEKGTLRGGGNLDDSLKRGGKKDNCHGLYPDRLKRKETGKGAPHSKEG